MKKFAKMSLVAAVAVAGLTSYASASSLEEAIKDTTISGYLRYRFNTDHENSLDTVNNTKIVAIIKTKVNDNLSASVKLSKEDEGISTTVPVTQMYFTYVNGPLTAKVGRTHLVSPLTDNGNNGDGVILTYGLGPVTLAGAYYNGVQNHANSVGSLNIYGVGAIGSVEMVNFQAWYLSTGDRTKVMVGTTPTTTDYDAYSAFVLQADAKFGPVGVSALYAEGDDDGVSGEDISFLTVGLNGSFGIVSANLDYIKTGEDSGDTTFDGDTDAEANVGLLTNDMMLVNDADAWHVGVSVAATSDITLSAHYLAVDSGSNSNINDATETELDAKYQMSKNFYVLGRYSFGDVSDVDFQNSRIELMYTF